VFDVGGVEECAHELVCALRRGRCVETVETRDGGGGAHRHDLSPVIETCAVNKASRVRRGRPRLLSRASDSLGLWISNRACFATSWPLRRSSISAGRPRASTSPSRP